MLASLVFVFCFLVSVFASPCDVYVCSTIDSCKEKNSDCNAFYYIKYPGSDVRGVLFDVSKHMDYMFHANKNAVCSQLRDNAVFWIVDYFYDYVGAFDSELSANYKDLPTGFYYEKKTFDVDYNCIHVDQLSLPAYSFN